MPLLQHLRQARQATCALLVGFVLSLGAAIASPMVNPQSMTLICTGTGVMKLLVSSSGGPNDGGGPQVASGTADCPLCAHAAAPSPLAQTGAVRARPLGHALRPAPVARIAARAAAPLPARGPPAFS